MHTGMRLRILYTVCTLCCIAAAGGTDVSAGGIAGFGIKNHDFGTVEEKSGKISHTFTFTNTGDSSLTLLDAATSCRCVSASFSREPVEPGGSGTVIVTFDPAYRKGDFAYSIRITHSGSPSPVRLQITGNVIPALHPIEEDRPYDLGDGVRSNLKVFLFGGIRQGESKSILFRYGNGTTAPMSVRLNKKGDCPGALSLRDTVMLKADERREEHVSFTMPEGQYGLQEITVIPSINGRDAGTPIKVTAVGLPRKGIQTPFAPKAVCSPTRFTAKASAEEQVFILNIGNTGMTRMKILSVDLPEGVSADLYDGQILEPGEKLAVRLTLESGYAGKKGYHGQIFIVTDSPSTTYFRIIIDQKQSV